MEPMGFRVDDAKLKRAGLDYWHLLDITYYCNLDDFFERNKDGNFYYFSTKRRIFTQTLSIPTTATSSLAKRRRGCQRSCSIETPTPRCACR